MNYDYSALREPHSKNEVRQFVRSGNYKSGAPNPMIAAIAFGGVTSLLFSATLQTIFGFRGDFDLTFIIGSLIFVIVGGLILFIYRRANLDNAKDQYANFAFATANNLEYAAVAKISSRNGTIFHTGNGHLTDVFTDKDGAFEIGNLTLYRDGSRAYICIKLPQSFPQIILNGTKNDQFLRLFGQQSLPFHVEANQKVSLEGDFDNYFTLYAPNGYERAALYVFTPDVMERIIQSASDYDAEIVGDELYIYQLNGANFSDPETLKRFFALADGIMQELSKQITNYRPEPSAVHIPESVRTDASKTFKNLSISQTIFYIVGVLVLFLLFQLIEHLIV